MKWTFLTPVDITCIPVHRVGVNHLPCVVVLGIKHGGREYELKWEDAAFVFFHTPEELFERLWTLDSCVQGLSGHGAARRPLWSLHPECAPSELLPRASAATAGHGSRANQGCVLLILTCWGSWVRGWLMLMIWNIEYFCGWFCVNRFKLRYSFSYFHLVFYLLCAQKFGR